MGVHAAEHHVRVLGVGLAAAVTAAAWMAPAAPGAARAQPVVQRAASLPGRGSLYGVAATSARNAWAVGQAGPEFTSKSRTLIARWVGTAWKRVPSPTPAGGATLFGVSVSSARQGWAVGLSGSVVGTKDKTLILRWNGTTWRQVPSPTPAGGATLYDVAAISARSAWAVGSAYRRHKTLILHWNGTAWSRVPSPTPAGGGFLRGVAATSASSAWAVGANYTFDATLIARWNGSAWTRVRSPDPSPGAVLSAVAATSASSAWAVGSITGRGTTPAKTLILHWNGTSWRQVPSPTPAEGAGFRSVAATSARNAWAIGGTTFNASLIAHWNGSAWTPVPSPTPAGRAILEGVAATSASSAWAVGYTDLDRILDLHWNGTIWQ